MLGALIGAGASLLGGLFGSSSAEKAAQAQADAANRATALQKRMYEQTRADQMPWLEAGKTALSTYMGQLDGTGDANAFKATPGYEWRVSQGEKGVMNNLAAMGAKNSGKALKSLERFRQGIASEEYDKWFGRVGAAAGQGQQASNSMAASSANAANSMSNTIQGAGEARASGYVGSANAWTGALNSAANFLGQGSGSNSFGSSSGFRNMIGY